MVVFVGFPKNKSNAYGNESNDDRKHAGVASEQNYPADTSTQDRDTTTCGFGSLLDRRDTAQYVGLRLHDEPCICNRDTVFMQKNGFIHSHPNSTEAHL
jgi:hypothetical protein